MRKGGAGAHLVVWWRGTFGFTEALADMEGLSLMQGDVTDTDAMHRSRTRGGCAF